MADIKNYVKEREKRGNPISFNEKIRRHKLTYVYRIFLALGVVGGIVALVFMQYSRHVYTNYEILSSIPMEEVRGAKNVPFEGNILTYSKDGVHCSDSTGNMKWNLTYEMQNPMVEICKDVVAIADYNGRNIYVSNTTGSLGEIQTNMPIRNLCVSSTGLVAAILEDLDITWIYLFDSNGNLIVKSQTTMKDYGYPVAFDISPSGEFMMISFLYLDAGEIKTRVAFFNFGEVGQSQVDNLVGGYNYTDTLIPYVQFMDEETSFALGDNRIIFYQGANKPEFIADHLFDYEVKGVYYNKDYVGLVSLNDTGESKYRIVIYNKGGEEIHKENFDIEYTNLFFDQETFVIYNDTECEIYTIEGREKYRGSFEKPVELMTPTSKAYRYILVTKDSIDTILLH